MANAPDQVLGKHQKLTDTLSALVESMQQYLKAEQSKWKCCICLGSFTGPNKSKRAVYALPCLSSNAHRNNSIWKECANEFYTQANNQCSSGNGVSIICCPLKCQHAIVFQEEDEDKGDHAGRRMTWFPVCLPSNQQFNQVKAQRNELLAGLPQFVVGRDTVVLGMRKNPIIIPEDGTMDDHVVID